MYMHCVCTCFNPLKGPSADTCVSLHHHVTLCQQLYCLSKGISTTSTVQEISQFTHIRQKEVAKILNRLQ